MTLVRVFGGAVFYFLICQEPERMAGAQAPPGSRRRRRGGGVSQLQRMGVTSLLPPTVRSRYRGALSCLHCASQS